jgi:DNA-binding beta-propeller fold protein YncE
VLSFPLLLALAPALQPAPLQLRRLTVTPPAVDGPAADCAPQSLVLPAYAGSADLAVQGGLVDCNAPAPGPWSGAWSPDGASLYVTLFGGGFGAENCRVARLDATTLEPVTTIPVGLGPEEIVFTTSSPTAIRHGFVSNSTSSTVTVFDAAGQVVATVPIPFAQGGFPTAFPTGLAVSPDQTRVYVGTLDGSGNVYAIDALAHVLVPSETIALGPGHGFGRMAFAGDRLVLTATLFHAGLQGSTGEVVLLDPSDPEARTVRVLATSPDARAFPSPMDVATWCDRVYVAGFDLGARVFELSAATGELVATIPTGTSNRYGKFQGLGVGPDGLLVVADYLTDEIAWIDPFTRSPLSVVDASALPDWHAQLNDVLVNPSGARFVLAGQASSTLAVFDRP